MQHDILYIFWEVKQERPQQHQMRRGTRSAGPGWAGRQIRSSCCNSSKDVAGVYTKWRNIMFVCNERNGAICNERNWALTQVLTQGSSENFSISQHLSLSPHFSATVAQTLNILTQSLQLFRIRNIHTRVSRLVQVIVYPSHPV